MRYTQNAALGGCLALSTYFPGNMLPTNDLNNLTNKLDTPVLQCHGESDGIVKIERGQITADLLNSHVKDHTFIRLPNLKHEINDEVQALVKGFIAEKLQ